MPTISNATIRAIYHLCGDPHFPVEEYCIGCEHCEYYGFPCANCAAYVFGYQLGFGERGEADSGENSDTKVGTPSRTDEEPTPMAMDCESCESVTSPCDDIDPESPLGLILQASMR